MVVKFLTIFLVCLFAINNLFSIENQKEEKIWIKKDFPSFTYGEVFKCLAVGKESVNTEFEIVKGRKSALMFLNKTIVKCDNEYPNSPCVKCVYHDTTPTVQKFSGDKNQFRYSFKSDTLDFSDCKIIKGTELKIDFTEQAAFDLMINELKKRISILDVENLAQYTGKIHTSYDTCGNNRNCVDNFGLRTNGDLPNVFIAHKDLVEYTINKYFDMKKYDSICKTKNDNCDKLRFQISDFISNHISKINSEITSNSSTELNSKIKSSIKALLDTKAKQDYTTVREKYLEVKAMVDTYCPKFKSMLDYYVSSPQLNVNHDKNINNKGQGSLVK